MTRVLIAILLAYSWPAFGEPCKPDTTDLVVELITDRMPYIESPEKRVEAIEDRLNSITDTGECYDYARFFLLPFAIRYSALSEQYTKMNAYAFQVEQLLKIYPDDWNYGNALHDVRMAKGIDAINSGRQDLAKEYLISSIDIPTSPQINSFGTNLLLADMLLEHGFINPVIEYLKGLEKIWSRNGGKVDLWIHQIEKGLRPDFGANLEI